jgi:hypothetical protein
MKTAIIASCSHLKRNLEGLKITASRVKRGSYIDVAAQWQELVAKGTRRTPAYNLYLGRGAQEIRLAASAINADIWFASAGLGLITSNEEIPAYDLTVSKESPAFIGNKINSKPFDSTEWWTALNKESGIRKLQRILTGNKYGLVLFAMQSVYFNMIATTMDNLPSKALSKIRIIGPPRKSISKKYHPFLMPYDDRLNGPNSPLRGTRGDFPQRAARHFAEYILLNRPSSDIDEHLKLVSAQLHPMKFPSIIKRQQMTDSDVSSLILKNWKLCAGRVGMALRILRDDEMVACEQGRFKGLFMQIKKQKDKKKRREMTDSEISSLILKNWKLCAGQVGTALRMLRDGERVACEQERFKGLFIQIKKKKGKKNGVKAT